ncbi:MAG TPA: alcohol dehydrogenase family protein [Hypericibacter adhaerens]|uniref:Alcohol dehydrogenase n=1 Tax=Hypericibacter adhaerens TaxID=2602016 RepID=A0A5J6MY95_9PROT|nr:alcohol dehydrogenase family protein [Hypericibacter adhaerens]QEX22678.1 alcohol dehydrogenase [Hypericibacter adhaerens]HWA42859.1 alcohol dehydrogenase family protein [Hypericibacter adhaerens]
MPPLPSIMKAVLLKGNGGFDQLEYREDVPVPKPGAGEVLIRVGAAGVNNTDINTRTGWYSKSVTEGTTASGGSGGFAAAKAADAAWTGEALSFPRIQGIDACGRIVAVGPGVDASRIGERVLIEPAFRSPFGWAPYRALFFGSECDGAFAEYARAPSAHAHRIESRLSDAELASFPCAYATAENMLTRAGLGQDETVLVTGASGGVGSAALQLARRRGARIIAVANPSKTAALEALGASRVLARDADLVAAVGPESVDVVIDVAGGPQFPQLLELLRRGGRYAAAGAIAGPVVALDLRTLYLKDLRLLGCTVLEPGVFENLVRYIERGEIRPVIAGIHPLREIVAAQKEFLAKQHTGKIVLVPSP